MSDVKQVDTSRKNNKEYLKAKNNELETKSKKKKIRDLYRDINDFKKGYQPRTNVAKMRSVIWLQTPTLFWLGGEILSFTYCM
jgi:hypothetical protein